MKEIKDIIQAFEWAKKRGKRTALATVVHVEGSSYRRPGARMLVTEDGELTGAISGGCLEGDALRKALLAIRENRNKLVTYDTTDEDDANFGVQLGCNGIVHILFEPIDASVRENVIVLLKALTNNRQKGVLVTLFDLERNSKSQPGTCLLFLEEKMVLGSLAEGIARDEIMTDLHRAFRDESSASRVYSFNGHSYTAFIEFIPPVIALVILGAGNDVIPLVNMAALLGWHVSVIDGRPNYAHSLRFPDADRVVVAKAGEVRAAVQFDEYTVFVLMSHNYNYDLQALRYLAFEPTRYIGVLGPKSKLERMISELGEEGVVLGEEELAKIYGPVGLDLGAETAEEIALSVVSEVKTIMSGRISRHLRDKQASIHAPRVPFYDGTKQESATFL